MNEIHELRSLSVPEMTEVDGDTIDVNIPTSSGMLLFTKSKVYVHPSSTTSKKNIPGYLSLSQISVGDYSGRAGNHFLLSWIPEDFFRLHPEALNAYRDAESGVNTMAAVSLPSRLDYAFSVRLSDVYSILFCPPKYNWSYGRIIINLRNEQDLVPPLYFHDDECRSTIEQEKAQRKSQFDPFDESGDVFWGGAHFLMFLKRYAHVVRANGSSQLFLINPTSEDIISSRALMSSVPDTSSFAAPYIPPTPSVNIPPTPSVSISPETREALVQPMQNLFAKFGWNVFSKFSKVTLYGREKLDQALDHPIAKSIVPHLPKETQLMLSSNRVKRLAEEYDPARLFLAHWAEQVAEQAESMNSKRDSNGQIITETTNEEPSAVGSFELITLDTLAPHAKRGKPLTKAQWSEMFDAEGRFVRTQKECLSIIFHGSIEPDIRGEVWPFLLEIYPWTSTAEERVQIDRQLRSEYRRLKEAWYNDLDRQMNDAFFLEQKHRIEKDVHRTDRQHEYFAEENLPHPDPQSTFTGTNLHMEMLKDILLTYNDDSMAFWGMVGLMKRMCYNFRRDQKGMRRQLETLRQLIKFMDPILYNHLEKTDSANLFCFFRMLLIYFKREFDWTQLLQLWDVLFTNFLSYQFHIFVAMAIMERHREVILSQTHAFDEVLKYFNDLGMHISLDPTLECAEQLFYRFRSKVEMIDRRNSEKEQEDKASSTSKAEDKPEPQEVTKYLRSLLGTEPVDYSEE
ncbi:GTPase activating protein Gyp7 [Schizosaccharomyces japonicus yFS275]|uniref:GTPase activating protein Gyp7 n=1 Tax=Schizosaccharomyces japonicus (strain yFS275 / FY16936) TaxID=402676 RepID=B6K340_SCHJY|nr:GTPase activating protein Gyp7 [Schizosaccharomyces japonicus yFS275]EEB07897.1 GTPase activating protein Gyp7 [Schizosaccharomyces japonicus yFS275]